jgi:hypothetical protein
MEDLVEHLPVARLKDMERQQGLWKQRDVGQRHHGRLIWNLHGQNVTAVVPDGKGEIGEKRKQR